MANLVRTSQHSLKAVNSGKAATLATFVCAYRAAVRHYIDFLWTTRIVTDEHVLDVAGHEYHVPAFIPKLPGAELDTRLTARALKCASTQACGIVSAVLTKRLKDEARLEWLLSKRRQPSPALLDRLAKQPTCPDAKNINCELNSIIAAVGDRGNSFDLWLNLSALFTNKHGFKLAIPSQHHRQSRKWQARGTLMPSVLLNEHSVQLRWSVPTPVLKAAGTIAAVDQGVTDLLTVSDRRVFDADAHGHTMTSILRALARKRKGSKAFAAAQAHRQNYVNWYVKRVDLTSVRELKLEKIEHISYRNPGSRFLSGFTNTLIENSIQRRCEENGVRLTYVDNEYNSQRCSRCGWTQKSNRRGKLFKCKACKHTDDADCNASDNILVRDTLVPLPSGFRMRKLNINGFFWNREGLVDAYGKDLTVPSAEEAPGVDSCLG